MQKLHPTLGLNVVDLCDTTNITYHTSIVNILQNSCYGCHSTSNAASNGSGYVVDNYTDLNTLMANAQFPQCFDAASGLSLMPKGSNALPQCELDVINKWIAAGAPNN